MLLYLYISSKKGIRVSYKGIIILKGGKNKLFYNNRTNIDRIYIIITYKYKIATILYYLKHAISIIILIRVKLIENSKISNKVLGYYLYPLNRLPYLIVIDILDSIFRTIIIAIKPSNLIKLAITRFRRKLKTKKLNLDLKIEREYYNKSIKIRYSYIGSLKRILTRLKLIYKFYKAYLESSTFTSKPNLRVKVGYISTLI
ncbi:hypothetical protein JOL62DRAFT_560066 [Phyllosticta paracitricarpa]|uniref:Uncharacterized protein n=1 Tax=Phyllosticta paracitricarpa TaxID=2016321 RepID=A0ABR1MUL4_9PEZI